MPATITDNKATSTFVAFTPRQVLLGMKHNSDNNASSNGTVRLKREEKVLLHHSIAHYLQRCGFSKTLKKFRSEAQFEKDNVEGSSVDLEEICLKYLELCSKDAKADINYQNEQVVGKNSKKDGEDDPIVDMDKASKKKKKKSDKSGSDAVVHQSGTDETFKGSKNSGEKTNHSDPESIVISKEKGTDKKCKEKKKKSKLASESLAKNVEDNQMESQPTVTYVKLKESTDTKTVNGAKTQKKSKDKKTKKDKQSCDGDAKELQIRDPNEIVSEKDNFKTSNKDVTDKKDSKKRKRPSSEENDVQLANREADEETKRRKEENLNESEGGESAKANANLGSGLNPNKDNIGASGQVGKTNGNLENTGEKSSVKRSQKKQGSVEQKAFKAFQRVKIDEVVFTDERLQDNSYWAKDGAESGYGAKAEEILSQVRGRDFRHEKTKKKRGTYRGGQIDLQSHSIKFNDSDDE